MDHPKSNAPYLGFTAAQIQKPHASQEQVVWALSFLRSLEEKVRNKSLWDSLGVLRLIRHAG